MNDTFFSDNSLRPKSALEIAIQARAKEKQMAMLTAEIGAEEARGRRAGLAYAPFAYARSLRSVLTSLLSLIIK